MNKISSRKKFVFTIMMNPNIAKGLSDPHRIKILDLLYHKELSTKELFMNLRRAKYKIAITTIRHHIAILRRNGLIKVSKTKEVKGTLVKYYISTVKILSYEKFPSSLSQFPSSNFNENKEFFKLLYSKFYKIIKKLIINEKGFMDDFPPQSKTKCNICNVFHYTEYLIFITLNIIITKVLQKLLKINA